MGCGRGEAGPVCPWEQAGLWGEGEPHRLVGGTGCHVDPEGSGAAQKTLGLNSSSGVTSSVAFGQLFIPSASPHLINQSRPPRGLVILNRKMPPTCCP